MNRLSTTLFCACIALAAGTASAQDTTKKPDTMPQTGMTTMTMQQCKDHMAMAKKDGMKKDDATMKMETMCMDMMNKGGMKKDMPADPMKK